MLNGVFCSVIRSALNRPATGLAFTLISRLSSTCAPWISVAVSLTNLVLPCSLNGGLTMRAHLPSPRSIILVHSRCGARTTRGDDPSGSYEMKLNSFVSPAFTFNRVSTIPMTGGLFPPSVWRTIGAVSLVSPPTTGLISTCCPLATIPSGRTKTESTENVVPTSALTSRRINSPVASVSVCCPSVRTWASWTGRLSPALTTFPRTVVTGRRFETK